MNENIDLVKILKDCQKGTKLYCLVEGEVSFLRVNSQNPFLPIEVLLDDGRSRGYSSEGKFHYNSKFGCVLLPSKEMRDWSKFTTPWHKKERFDPKTLNPFDRVLARDLQRQEWICTLFSHRTNNYHSFVCCNDPYIYCIPYNDDTKHLVGTKEEAPEYYRYWED